MALVVGFGCFWGLSSLALASHVPDDRLGTLNSERQAADPTKHTSSCETDWGRPECKAVLRIREEIISLPEWLDG